MALSLHNGSQEQQALFAAHEEEWVLVADDDDPEPAWQGEGRLRQSQNRRAGLLKSAC